ncbi:hypothetical protein MRY87_03645 [bacterium]|nr:hypothetical protein [bacterium]
MTENPEEMASEGPATEEAGSLLSLEEANALVEEHRGWAESIARSVARGWSLDWQSEGLDGAAMEALIFCSRRFDPSLGIPFRGYARRRIHEASTEAARQSKGWVKSTSSSQFERLAKEVSVELFELFPELRSGALPATLDGDGGSDKAVRASIRQLLVGATLVTTRQGLASSTPDELLDTKKVIGFLAFLEVIHQIILWRIYWDGDSMRSIASEWEMDELNVIREHIALIEHLSRAIQKDKSFEPLKIRPGLRARALEMKREKTVGPFTKLYTDQDKHP